MMDKAVLQAGTHHVLVMGDFNYPEINYECNYEPHLGKRAARLAKCARI